MKICRNGNHTLIEIIRCSVSYDEEKVVRWCKFCGAVVVDLEIDNRTHPGRYMEMQFPELMCMLKKKE